MSLSGDIISDMELDASIEAIGEIAGSINLDGSGSTPTITASATVSPDPGIPACDVVKTGTDEYPNFAFNFSGLKGEPGEQGVPGQNGQNGVDGSDGITPNLTATASVGQSTGTPYVTVTRSGTAENPNFYFQFDNLKGEQGEQGIQGETGSQGAPGTVPNVSASASVTNTSGIPTVTVTRTGADANPNFDFAFENLKGEQGIQGIPGQNGQNGADGSDGVTPIVSATASADNSYGIPNVVVTRSGTDAAPSFDFAFHNIKGEPGTSGVPAGGTTGQVLAKQSSADYDADWETLVVPSTAAEISFDNTGTGMTATDVQDAVTELKSNLTNLQDFVLNDEIVIGSWLGKPLYRRVYKVTTPNAINTSVEVKTINIGVKNYISVWANINISGNAISSSGGGSSCVVFMRRPSATEDKITMRTDASGYLNKDAYVVLEYTKTSDN